MDEEELFVQDEETAVDTGGIPAEWIVDLERVRLTHHIFSVLSISGLLCLVPNLVIMRMIVNHFVYALCLP